jgi:hypothetical protein
MNNQIRITNLFKRHPRHFIGVISCSYPLTANQISKHQDKLLWKQSDYGFYTAGISSNTNITWSFELLDKFIDKWDWDAISCYILGKHLWSEDIIDRYYDYISWTSLCCNQDIPWSEELIDKYENKIDWEWLTPNYEIPWTKEMIEKYEDKLNWSDLSNSSASPISRRYDYGGKQLPSLWPPDDIIDFVEKYEDRLDWNHLMWDWRKGLNRVQTDRIIENAMKWVPVLEWPPMSDPF